MAGDRSPVDVIVISRDNDGVVFIQDRRGNRNTFAPLESGMLPRSWNFRNKWVVEIGLGTAMFYQLDQFQGRALARILDVLFVCQANDQDPGAV